MRQPQRETLKALAQAIAASDNQLLNPKHDVSELLITLKAWFPKLSDFEQAFPSLCFAVSTGLGKTRLMAAFISYLHLVHSVNNFFILAPDRSIHQKLITAFSPGAAKYVFSGIAEFANNPPMVISCDNYQQCSAQLITNPLRPVCISIFDMTKINSEVRGGKAPRIKRLSEYLGDSYFSYLAGLSDLVLLMDESHRYRASAGVKALNDLQPIFGLELTATPFVETSRGTKPFKNVVVDYPLARAMDDGFVKDPAVVTQRNFDASQHSKEAVERIKLEDGIRLHEATKVELLTYAHQNAVNVVIARDTTHAAELLNTLETLFDGRYQGKVIQVDSSRSGAAEEQMIARLLAVESIDEPTEIVIHVNMLKEGWDVTNLYTIVPLRAANARVLIEQSIGRGLRLPYGKRTGVEAVDRLNIVAHDRFQEIVDEANNPKNPLRLKQLVLERPEDDISKESVQVSATIDNLISGSTPSGSAGTIYADNQPAKPLFNHAAETKVAQATLEAIKQLQHKPRLAPSSQALLQTTVQNEIAKAVHEQLPDNWQSALAPAATEAGTEPAAQPDPGATPQQQEIDIAAVIAKTTRLLVDHTIDIPRVMVTPKGEVINGYHPFTLDISQLRLNPQDHGLIGQSLHTNQQSEMGESQSIQVEPIKENYILRKFVDYDDICYDQHGDILRDLAHQAVAHLQSYLGKESDVENVLQRQSDTIARVIHAQLDKHFYEEATEYVVEVRSGFSELKPCAYTAERGHDVYNYRDTVTQASKIKQMLFGHFSQCLYPIQKFDSDTERRFAVILERDALKWFKPAKGQFQTYYKKGTEHPEYVPDFVVKTDNCLLMVETKSSQHRNADGSWNEEVSEKAKAGVKWCSNASEYLQTINAKPWHYLLIPHDEVKEANTLASYIDKFACS